MLKVKNKTLLMIASIVWMFAGFNVLRIGLLAYSDNVTILNLCLSLIVFCLFQFFVFNKLVKKHTKRILSYKEKQLFIHFFDLKSFLIMGFLMSGGIYLRTLTFIPSQFIAFFYTGLGSSLFLAGVLFGVEYLKCFDFMKKGGIMMIHKEEKYLDIACVYACIAMVAGVFYREITKFHGYSGHTMLSVIHTHYFILGTIVFLFLVLLEKGYSFTNNKTKKTVFFYQLGLNTTTLLMLIRGITQVLEITLSKGFDAAIAGIAGVSHMVLGVSIIFMLLMVRKILRNDC